MLCFVVPLKSSQVSQSWPTVSQLFERTVKSLCRQTNPNFRVIVVCNEKPEIKFQHPNLEYIQIALPQVPTTMAERRFDKMQKFLIGIRRAKEMGCSHIMLTDSDDCVSRSLAEFVVNNPQADGYFFKQGYIYKNNQKRIQIEKKRFNMYCGTSHIIKSDWYDVSEENLARIPNSISTDRQLPRDILHLYYRHRYFADAFKSQGANLQPLPFLGSVYILGNSENISTLDSKRIQSQTKLSLRGRLSKLRSYLFYRPRLTPELRDEFGLYDITS